jgi:hypothetical protein
MRLWCNRFDCRIHGIPHWADWMGIS